jgi:anti-sigma factor RsiW
LQDEATLFRNLDLTRRQAMDRYSQHVQHCSECKAALARTQAVAASAAIAAVAAVVGACVVASVRAAAALTPGAVPGWLLGMASWGFGGSGSVLGLAGPLLLLGLAAAGVHVLASKLEGLFHYREFVRPTF